MKDEYDFSNAKRGALVAPDPNKVRITIRLDPEILDYFRGVVERAGGGNYQTMINNVLRDFIHEKTTPSLETTLRPVIAEEVRRVIREELKAAG